MDAIDAQLARIRANIEAKNKNKNIEADNDPLHDLSANTITKSHALSRAYYRIGLVEKRCMEALISKLHPMRMDNPQFLQLSALEYAGVYKIPSNVAYRDISSAVSSLMDEKITAKRVDGKGKIEFTLMAKAEYMDDKGIIECVFNPLIVPYLVGLRDKFSSYPLKQAVSFSSSYAWRFFEILVSWAVPKHDTGGLLAGWIRKQSVEELREMLGVPESYTWGMFQKKVLDVVVLELKKNAKINIKFERIKTSRKITHLNIDFIEDIPFGDEPITKDTRGGKLGTNEKQTEMSLTGVKAPKKPRKKAV